jgi:hypothetical protein
MEIDMTDTTTHTAERTAEINAYADRISALAIGEGVTVSVWTDAEAYTLIKRTATTMTLREDKATRNPNFKPEIVAGGFIGHCINQHEQTYTYEPDLAGVTIKVSLRRWTDEEGNERRRWKKVGTGTFERGGNVYPGRSKFHDYNF